MRLVLILLLLLLLERLFNDLAIADGIFHVRVLRQRLVVGVQSLLQLALLGKGIGLVVIAFGCRVLLQSLGKCIGCGLIVPGFVSSTACP